MNQHCKILAHTTGAYLTNTEAESVSWQNMCSTSDLDNHNDSFTKAFLKPDFLLLGYIVDAKKADSLSESSVLSVLAHPARRVNRFKAPTFD